jgi:hypothetical protein
MSVRTGNATTWKIEPSRHLMAAALALAIAVLAVAAGVYVVSRDGGSEAAASAGATVSQSAAEPGTFYIVSTHGEAAELEAFGVGEFGTVLVEENGGGAIFESILVANSILLGQGLPEYKIVDLR